jgi:uncharacterized protein (DUF1810 family)
MHDASLQRFVDAQDPVWERVEAELRAGQKTSHWMWFVFPQIAGLGRSATSQRFAIASLEEACAYLEHPLLGERLRRSVGLLLAHSNRSAGDMLGPVDAMKLHSSLTLFRKAAPSDAIFGQVLETFFDGRPDSRTLELLER